MKEAASGTSWLADLAPTMPWHKLAAAARPQRVVYVISRSQTCGTRIRSCPVIPVPVVCVFSCCCLSRVAAIVMASAPVHQPHAERPPLAAGKHQRGQHTPAHTRPLEERARSGSLELRPGRGPLRKSRSCPGAPPAGGRSALPAAEESPVWMPGLMFQISPPQ